MSYDIYLRDPETNEVIETSNDLSWLRGGTYAVGGSKELWLNVTYNYGKFYYKTIDKDQGIRYIYGMSGKDSVPILMDAMSDLGDDVTDNYWDATEGNAKKALLMMVLMATLAPKGVWDGD